MLQRFAAAVRLDLPVSIVASPPAGERISETDDPYVHVMISRALA